MAKARSIPTQLYWDPQFSDLDGETQSVLIGITLDADDHGRGLAWPSRLARVLNKPAEVITTALGRLEATGFVCRYEVDGVPYYHHERWDKWQRLNNRAYSQFPAPPTSPTEHSPQSSESPGESPRVPASPGESPLEGEVEGGRGKENKNQEVEAEGESETRPANVIPLPTPGSGGGNGVLDGKAIDRVTREVATILKLPNDAALRRVVTDFLGDSNLSLLGEADAAREYIDNPRRNHRHKAMTPTFYRQWLKRERDQKSTEKGSQNPTSSTFQATGTTGSRPKTSLAERSLMNLESEYQGHTKQQQKGNQP